MMTMVHICPYGPHGLVELVEGADVVKDPKILKEILSAHDLCTKILPAGPCMIYHDLA